MQVREGTSSAVAVAAVAPLYRDECTGSEWQGRGLKPAWLRAKVAQGRALDDFLVPGGHQVGLLQVWWTPQIPMQPFSVSVASVAEGVRLLDVLAMYDLFQLEHRIKPDFANTGGLRRWCADSDGEGNPGWEDWYDEVSGIDDPREWLQQLAGSEATRSVGGKG